MRAIGPLALGCLLVLAVVATVRTWRLGGRQVAPGVAAAIDVNDAAAAARLGAAIRFRTVSRDDPADRDADEFAALTAWLGDAFPRVRASLTRETIGEGSLLFTWTGSTPSRPPLILAGHIDVVPVEPSTESAWTQPPFSGAVADGRIWGRGALDDKSCVLGILEAVEALLATGFAPDRTIYIALSDREEVNVAGAAVIAATLEQRGVRGATILDEGGFIYTGVPGITRKIAFVGITEKRAVNIELRATAPGGHASMPPPETAVTILARALDRVASHPMPARLDGAGIAMFDALAPEMPWLQRAIFANLWLTRPLVVWQLTRKPETNATVRTTVAPTELSASEKINVLADTARAALNTRVLPGDTPEDLVARLTSAIDDPRVAIRILSALEPAPPVSPIDTDDFRGLASAVRAVSPDVLVAPFLTMAATDARVYASIAPNAYRLLPIDPDGALDSMHGVNERIRVDVYGRAIRTYATIIRTLGAPHGPTPADR